MSITINKNGKKVITPRHAIEISPSIIQIMATSSTPRRSEDEKRASSHYHERNRTFSSTTTNHYKNKLAQIGIQKDLREILERKKLEKEQEKNNACPSNPSPNESSQVSRKVRFSEEKIPIRRSKSFTSGVTKTYDSNFENGGEVVIEKSSPKKFNKSLKGKRKEFFDLQNPINIKIELQSNSGERKCILDENVSLPNVKCDLKHCRNILNHSDVREKISYQTEKSRDKYRSQSFYRGGDRGKSFNNKNQISNQKRVQNEELVNTASDGTVNTADN